MAGDNDTGSTGKEVTPIPTPAPATGSHETHPKTVLRIAEPEILPGLGARQLSDPASLALIQGQATGDRGVRDPKGLTPAGQLLPYELLAPERRPAAAPRSPVVLDQDGHILSVGVPDIIKGDSTLPAVAQPREGILKTIGRAIDKVIGTRGSGAESINENYPFVDAERTKLAPGVIPRWDPKAEYDGRPPTPAYYDTLLDKVATPEDRYMAQAIRSITSPTARPESTRSAVSIQDYMLGQGFRKEGGTYADQVEDPSKWVAQQDGQMITGDNFKLTYKKGDTAWDLVHRYQDQTALVKLEKASGIVIGGDDPPGGIYQSPKDLSLEDKIWTAIGAAKAKGEGIKVNIDGVVHNIFPYPTDRIEVARDPSAQTFSEIMQDHKMLQAEVAKRQSVADLEAATGIPNGSEPPNGIYKAPAAGTFEQKIDTGILAAKALGHPIKMDIDGVVHDVALDKFGQAKHLWDFVDYQAKELARMKGMPEGSKDQAFINKFTWERAHPENDSVRPEAPPAITFTPPPEPSSPERREMLPSEVKLLKPLSVWGGLGSTETLPGNTLPEGTHLYGVEDARVGNQRVIRNAKLVVPADGIEVTQADGTKKRILDRGGTMNEDGNREFWVSGRETVLNWTPDANLPRPSEARSARGLLPAPEPRAIADQRDTTAGIIDLTATKVVDTQTDPSEILRDLASKIEHQDPSLVRKELAEAAYRLGQPDTREGINEVARQLQLESTKLAANGDVASAAALRRAAIQAKQAAQGMPNERAPAVEAAVRDLTASDTAERALATANRDATQAMADLVDWAANPDIERQLDEFKAKHKGDESEPATREAALRLADTMQREFEATKGHGSVGKLMGADLFQSFILRQLGFLH